MADLTHLVRQTEKAAGLGKDIPEFEQAAAFPDNVKQIPMLAGRPVCPLACNTASSPGSEPNEHRPARRIADVAHHPVAPDAAAVGKVVAADEFSPLGEPAGEIGCLERHGLPQNKKARRRGRAFESVAWCCLFDRDQRLLGDTDDVVGQIFRIRFGGFGCGRWRILVA